MKQKKHKWLSWVKWGVTLALPMATTLIMATSFRGTTILFLPHGQGGIILCRGNLLAVKDNFLDDFQLDFSPTLFGSAPPTMLLEWAKAKIEYQPWSIFEQKLLLRAAAYSPDAKSYPLWPLLVLSLLWPGYKLWRAARSFRRKSSDKQTVPCPICGYDLRAHAPGSKCPECGTPIPHRPLPALAQ
jgi:hypothetical protein